MRSCDNEPFRTSSLSVSTMAACCGTVSISRLKTSATRTRADALGAQYANFVTRELMPFIERHYPVARGAANTGFGGSSYGAIAALYTALVNPGKFGRLLIESPSLYVGNRYLLRQAKLAERWPSRIYLGVGTAETSRADWNEETVANVRRLEEMLRTDGLGPRRLKVVIDEGRLIPNGRGRVDCRGRSLNACLCRAAG